ncbi:SRF-like protein [Dioscorea alata]|uniref:SRF-like protein n=1 Tax=Dioscorea alata TaxID=55571 RepID=A0ACB7W9Y6_DIOAL|nr:SRF-like protein [Dioscorea alata]
MGRAKLPLKLIQDKTRRSITFRKRFESVKKKAFELSILCDVPVMFMFTGLDGQMHVWPEDRNVVLGIADRLQQLKKKDRRPSETSLSDFLSGTINATEADLHQEIPMPLPQPLMSASSDIFGEPYLQFDGSFGGNLAFGEGCSSSYFS